MIVNLTDWHAVRLPTSQKCWAPINNVNEYRVAIERSVGMRWRKEQSLNECRSLYHSSAIGSIEIYVSFPLRLRHPW